LSTILNIIAKALEIYSEDAILKKKIFLGNSFLIKLKVIGGTSQISGIVK